MVPLMRNFLKLNLIIPLLFLCFSLNSFSAYLVVDVVDGDTLWFLNDGKKEKLRLSQIDAPERSQPYGLEATQFLEQLVLDKEITIDLQGKKDRYGRYLGEVFFEEENINKLLVYDKNQNKKQIGKFQSYEDYIDSMKETFSECYKVLKEGRFMAINIGTVVSKEGMKFVCGDFVKTCEEVNFIFRKDIIWHKPKGTTKWQRGATQFTQNPYPLFYNTNINHEFIFETIF